VQVRGSRITHSSTPVTFSSMTAAAVCCTLILLCPASFSSDIGSPRGKVALVAPLYIANDRFTSKLALMNKTDDAVAVFVTLDSLEGEETARRPTTLAPHSSISMDVGSIPMTEHRFAALGSISISVASPVEKALAGQVTIASRAGIPKIQIEEDLQPVDAYPVPLHVGFVPASFSVPVLAIHSLDQLPQRISVVCSDSRGGSYESQVVLPGHMTFLVNACISEKSERRTYEQVLSGDTGPRMGHMTIKIKATDLQRAISVWGFATATIGAELGLQATSIEFVEWDPSIEFLLWE
jgi:hypothetical protein